MIDEASVEVIGGEKYIDTVIYIDDRELAQKIKDDIYEYINDFGADLDEDYGACEILYKETEEQVENSSYYIDNDRLLFYGEEFVKLAD